MHQSRRMPSLLIKGCVFFADFSFCPLFGKIPYLIYNYLFSHEYKKKSGQSGQKVDKPSKTAIKCQKMPLLGHFLLLLGHFFAFFTAHFFFQKWAKSGQLARKVGKISTVGRPVRRKNIHFFLSAHFLPTFCPLFFSKVGNDFGLNLGQFL